MSFIKHGDGKIINLINEEQLTEDQKKSIKKAIKQTDKQTDASVEKKSGS
jgi:hypothetical protein